MSWRIAVGAALLALTSPTPALASSSHGGTHGDVWFALSYDGGVRISYAGRGRAVRAQRAFLRRFRAHMALVSPKVTSALRAAKRRGFPLLKLDLAYPELRRLADLPKLRKGTFPVIVELRIQPEGVGHYALRVAVSKAPSQAQLGALTKKLTSALKGPWKQPSAGSAKRAATKVVRPSATLHLGAAAIYAGARFMVSPHVAKHYERQLRTMLSKARPVLVASLAKAKVPSATSVLLPLSRWVNKAALKGAHFNPHGPLLDSGATYQRIRPRFQNRYLLVSTLFIAKKGAKDALIQARAVSHAVFVPLYQRRKRLREDLRRR